MQLARQAGCQRGYACGQRCKWQLHPDEPACEGNLHACRCLPRPATLPAPCRVLSCRPALSITTDTYTMASIAALMTELCQLPFSQRIDTVLQNCHIVARGGARAFLRQHEVRAWIPKDRAWGPVTSSSTGVDPATVQVDGAPLPWTSPVHLVLHKPAGFTCTHAANEGDTVRVARHSCGGGAGGERCYVLRTARRLLAVAGFPRYSTCFLLHLVRAGRSSTR